MKPKIRSGQLRAPTDVASSAVLGFLLTRMPWDTKNEWTARICIPGIDNGHAIWLETTFKRRSQKQAENMLAVIVANLKKVRVHKEA
jgi:hypothetical protein